MYCKTCGNQIDLDSVFCSFCGTKQSEVHKPDSKLEHTEQEKQPEVKSLNVNLSLGRQNQSKTVQEEKNQKQPKYDSTYQSESGRIVFGVLILFISFSIAFIGAFQFSDSESLNQFRALTSVSSLILRIIVVSMVVSTANRQNRQTFGWGVFAFFLPSIALIVIGAQKKLFLKIEIDENNSNKENSEILCEKSIILLNDRKFEESFRFAEKAIELDSNNNLAKETFEKAKLQIPIDKLLKKGIKVIFRETVDGRTLKIVSNDYKIIGSQVFIDDKIAPDDEYAYTCEKRNFVLIVSDGKIEKLLT